MMFFSRFREINPDYSFEHITEITPAMVKRMGVEAVAVDLDNTVVCYGSYKLEDGIREWCDSMRKAGIKVVVISNTVASRAFILSRKMGRVPFVAPAFKPATFGIALASRIIGVPVEKTAMIGDKLSTDILSAEKSGAVSVKVEPLSKLRAPVTDIPLTAEA